MKYRVNGVEAELTPHPINVEKLPDRWMVKTPEGAFTAVAVRSGGAVHISFRGRTYIIEKETRLSRGSRTAHSGEIHAPMPGLIVDVLVAEGDSVQKGDKLVVLEAMKTQQAFTAPFDGSVKTIGVAKGEQVAEGALMVWVNPAES